jgi:ectoine hydroxylase-related dioxygenase (phytanoyl-CoA dioxygenase family)
MTAPAAWLSAAQRACFENDGYLHVPGLLPAPWVDGVAAAIGSSFGTELAQVEAAARGELFSLQRLSERAPALQPYFHAGPAVEVACELLGPSVRLLSNRYVVKPARSNDIFPWHRDCEEFANVSAEAGITLWIPLGPVTAESGGLWYAPGSHRSPEPVAAPRPPVSFAMQRGDLVVHSFGTMHMSGRNRTDAAREVVTLELIRADTLHPLTGQPFRHAILLGT